MRCARCGNSWAPVAAMEAADPVAGPRPKAGLEGEPEAGQLQPVLEAAGPGDQDAGVGATPLRSPVVEPPARLLTSSAAFEEDAEDEDPPRSGVFVAAGGWVLTILLLAVLAYGALLYRSQIETAWPAAQRAYGLLGLH